MDWKKPDYVAISAERARRLQKIRANPAMLPSLKLYYKDHIPQFISDWGVTVDPRNIERSLPPVLPFILFPKQVEWIEWVLERWRNQEPGITEKSRDMGISWCALALACSLCLFYDGMAIGFGSRKEEYVDKLGDPKSLFHKGRMFLAYLPREFRGGWLLDKHAPLKRIIFPETGAIIAGEGGDGIGRGDRKSLYFVDEAAYLEHPDLADHSLSATTNCRIDVSSVNGMANSFAERRHGGKIKVFTAHWRDDPRKDDDWYAKKNTQLDPVTVAQEIDISYNASVAGTIIPQAWVQAAVDIDKKLGIQFTGVKMAALDVADQGRDLNCMAVRHGNKITRVDSWKGTADLDIYHSVENAFLICDMEGLQEFHYDADGLGASVRGDARKVNEARGKQGARRIRVTAFRGSAAVHNPEGQMIEGRKNIDFFENYKAQAWWALRHRFQATYRAAQGMPYDIDDIVCIASDIENLSRLTTQLSQPVWDKAKSGKLLVVKQPDGTISPNDADSVMMVLAPRRSAMVIDDSLLEDDAYAAR